jgi:Bacterial regulatory proteins, gntR family
VTDVMIDPESAVRSYLVALDDPTKLVDESKIADLEAALKRASDPIDKLKAMAELERVRNVNVVTYRLAFIQHARQWAAEHDIPGSTFRTFGVDDGTLRAAGPLGRPARTSSDGPRRSRASGGKRSSSVSARQIKAHVATRTGPFTLSDVAAAVGGSPMTLRKAIGELVSEGVVDRLGTDPKHIGRGRSPIVYTRR